MQMYCLYLAYLDCENYKDLSKIKEKYVHICLNNRFVLYFCKTIFNN